MAWKQSYSKRTEKEDLVDWDDYFNLHMLSEKKTEMYVKLAKIMLIFQGPKGSEKKRSISSLPEKFKYASCILSDETFEDKNFGVFDPEKTDEFYDYFKSAARKACQEGNNLIVINQSINSVRNCEYYIFLAERFQYVILILPPIVSSSDSELWLHSTKSQAKSLLRIGASAVDMEGNFFTHCFCGWFLHQADSLALRSESALYVQDCFENISQFANYYRQACDVTNFREYFNLEDRKQDLAYCVVKIFNDNPNAVAYFNKKCVQQFYGKMTKLVIVGFIVSPYIIAARIKLSASQRHLWDMPNDFDESIEDIGKNLLYPSKLRQETIINFEGEEDLKSIAFKANPTLVSYDDPLLDPLSPISEIRKGRSCHIVLGKAPKASALNIDYGVPFAVNRENKFRSENPDALDIIDNDRSLVYRIGKYWFIYLKQQLVIDGFFASCSKAKSFRC